MYVVSLKEGQGGTERSAGCFTHKIYTGGWMTGGVKR